MMKRILATLLSLAMLLMLMPMAMPASAATEISNIAIGVVSPEAGRNPRYEVSGLPTGLVPDTEDDTYGEAQENGVVWFCEDQPVPATACFEVGKVYKVRVHLIRASEEYTVATDPIRTINGQNAYLQYGNYMYIVLEYTFPALEGHTITFSAGSGSGTMASVNGVAGEYTLPNCSFTAPYSTQVFKCWDISTDSAEWQPGETIPVYQDITVTAVWKNKDSRVETFDVACTSEDLESIPVLYGKKKIPEINTTHGHPAYVTDSTSNLKWQRKDGDTWVYDNTGRFTPGEWRIITQVRIDERSDPSNQFVLGDPVTLTVNGQAWAAENGTGKPLVDANYSMIFFVSPSFVIVDNPNIQPPAPVGQVTLRLEGYQSGSPVADAVVKGNDCINISGALFFEADSIDDFMMGNPEKIREATGAFSADKFYAVMVGFSAKDGYILDNLAYENISFENAAGEIMEYLSEDTFSGAYILNPPAKCTVTFNSNGGSAVASQNVDFGQKATKPADPTKDGFDFKGWTLDGFAYDFSAAVNADITLFASWEAKAPSNPCANGHSFGEYVYNNDATTKADGTKTRTCSVCGAKDTVTAEGTKVANPFTDVKTGAFYEEAVLWAVGKDITNGLTDTTFGPGKTCTRGQIVAFLWRAAGSPEPKTTTNPFTDVKEGKFYYKAVLWAVENGITNGTSATTFGPNNPCTRGQVVTFLWRAKGGEKVSASNPFTDVNKGFYVDAVAWAVKNEITTGVSATSFAPGKPCTRGQIVTFLYRAYK